MKTNKNVTIETYFSGPLRAKPLRIEGNFLVYEVTSTKNSIYKKGYIDKEHLHRVWVSHKQHLNGKTVYQGKPDLSALPNDNIDKRYSYNLEYCGNNQPMFVARFCGGWIGAYVTPDDAKQACRKHNEVRQNENP